jgi:3-phenylpropionate/trans-cinnamate dioxygenase ferredoxin component
MSWIRVAAVGDIAEGEAIQIDREPPIALFRSGGEYFATDDWCPHGLSSLADGYVDSDATVECSAHLARFCLRTGRVLLPPATDPIATYPVRIDGSEILVEVGETD